MAVEILMAIAHQEQIVLGILFGRHHGSEEPEGLRVEILNLIDEDMLEARALLVRFQNRPGSP